MNKSSRLAFNYCQTSLVNYLNWIEILINHDSWICLMRYSISLNGLNSEMLTKWSWIVRINWNIQNMSAWVLNRRHAGQIWLTIPIQFGPSIISDTYWNLNRKHSESGVCLILEKIYLWFSFFPTPKCYIGVEKKTRSHFFPTHGCLKWLFIDFFSKMSHFISQKSWKLVANNQIY